MDIQHSLFEHHQAQFKAKSDCTTFSISGKIWLINSLDCISKFLLFIYFFQEMHNIKYKSQGAATIHFYHKNVFLICCFCACNNTYRFVAVTFS